ncbi:hypothetical protein AgCh_009334 [Apium graveolens]
MGKREVLEAVRGGAAGSMVMELFGERIIEREFKAGGFVEYMVNDLRMGFDVVDGQESEKVVESGVRGQRPLGVCFDGRPPPVVNDCPHWGRGVNPGAPYPGDKDVSNIWGKPRLDLRPRITETSGSGGLSLAREMPYP